MVAVVVVVVVVEKYDNDAGGEQEETTQAEAHTHVPSMLLFLLNFLSSPISLVFLLSFSPLLFAPLFFSPFFSLRFFFSLSLFFFFLSFFDGRASVCRSCAPFATKGRLSAWSG